jgi:hypothetical protein
VSTFNVFCYVFDNFKTIVEPDPCMVKHKNGKLLRNADKWYVLNVTEDLVASATVMSNASVDQWQKRTR